MYTYVCASGCVYSVLSVLCTALLFSQLYQISNVAHRLRWLKHFVAKSICSVHMVNGLQLVITHLQFGIGFETSSSVNHNSNGKNEQQQLQQWCVAPEATTSRRQEKHDKIMMMTMMMMGPHYHFHMER